MAPLPFLYRRNPLGAALAVSPNAVQQFPMMPPPVPPVSEADDQDGGTPGLTARMAPPQPPAPAPVAAASASPAAQPPPPPPQEPVGAVPALPSLRGTMAAAPQRAPAQKMPPPAPPEAAGSAPQIAASSPAPAPPQSTSRWRTAGGQGPLYMAPGPADGLVRPGTIDLTTLPAVNLGNGMWGTVHSASREVNGVEVLYPQIVNGKLVSDDEAFRYAMQTGRNLGTFTDGDAADKYALRLHNDWAAGKIPGVQMTAPGGPPTPPPVQEAANAGAPIIPAQPAAPTPQPIAAPAAAPQAKTATQSAAAQKLSQLETQEANESLPGNNIWQRIALAAMSFTGLRPIGDSLVHPQWYAQEANRQHQISALQKEVADEQTEAQTAANQERADAYAQQAKATADQREAANQARLQAANDRSSQQWIQHLGPNSVPLQAGEKPPAGWSVWQNPFNPALQFARPSPFLTVTDPDLAKALRVQPGAQVSQAEYDTALKSVQAQDLEAAKLKATPAFKPNGQTILAAKSLGLPDDPSQWSADDAAKIFAKIKPPQPTMDLSPEAIAGLSGYFGKTGEIPNVGWGNSGTNIKRQILNHYFSQNPNGDPALARAVFKSDAGAMSQLQKNATMVTTFENTAGKNLDLFLQTAKPIVDSGSPILNRPLRSIDQNTLGANDLAAFNAARNVALTEIAKVVNSANLSGQLSDSARKEVESLNPATATLGQIYAVSQVLKQDMENRRESYDVMLNSLQGQMSGKSATLGTGGPPPSVNPNGIAPPNGLRPPKPGTKLTDKNITKAYLDRAGGNVQQARQQAQKDGWTF